MCLIYLNLMLSLNSYSQNVLDSLQLKLSRTDKALEKILLCVVIADKLAAISVDSAIAYCYKGLKLSKEIKNDSLEGACINCLINAYYEKPYFEDSALYFVPYYEKEIAGHNFNKLNYETYSLIADVYLKKHDYLNATHWCQLSIDEAGKTGQPSVIGAAKSYLGEMYRKAANYEESRRIFGEVVEIGKKENIPGFIFSGYRGIGISYDISSDFENAEKYFNLALDLAIESKQSVRIATANSLLGVAQLHLKKYDEALLSIHKAEEYYKSVNHEQIITVSQNLCHTFRDMGKLDSAEFYCKRGLEEAIKRNQQYSVSLLNGFTADIYEKQGNYKLAIEHLRRRMRFDDSTNTLDRTKAIAELEAKFKNKEKQTQITLLTNENFLKKLILEKQQAELLNTQYDVLEQKEQSERNAIEAKSNKLQLENNNKINKLMEKERQAQIKLLNEQTKSKSNQRNLILVVAILILLLVAYNFFTYRQRQQLKLSQQNEAALKQMHQVRDKIAQDLHDDIGSNLSKISLMSEVVNKYAENAESKMHMKQIAATARETLSQMSEMVWTVNRKNDSLQNLVIYIRKYAAEYFEHTAISCMIEMPASIPDLEINGEQRRNIFLAVKEACHNIVKHSNATIANIDFTITNNQFVIAISDNGKGMDDKNCNLFGNGMINMKERMKKSGGTFELLNGVGTSVILTLPLLST